MWWVIWWWEFSKIQVGEASNTSDPLWKAHICWLESCQTNLRRNPQKNRVRWSWSCWKTCSNAQLLGSDAISTFNDSVWEITLKRNPREWYWNIMTWHTSFQKMVWENCMFHMVFTKFFDNYHRVSQKPDSPRLLPAEVYTDTPNSETNRKLWNAYAQSCLAEVNELPVMWVLPIFLQSEEMIKRTKCV